MRLWHLLGTSWLGCKEGTHRLYGSCRHDHICAALDRSTLHQTSPDLLANAPARLLVGRTHLILARPQAGHAQGLLQALQQAQASCLVQMQCSML